MKAYLEKLDVFKLWEPDEIRPRILDDLPQKTLASVMITHGEDASRASLPQYTGKIIELEA